VVENLNSFFSKAQKCKLELVSSELTIGLKRYCKTRIEGQLPANFAGTAHKFRMHELRYVPVLPKRIFTKSYELQCIPDPIPSSLRTEDKT